MEVCIYVCAFPKGEGERGQGKREEEGGRSHLVNEEAVFVCFVLQPFPPLRFVALEVMERVGRRVVGIGGEEEEGV